MTVSWPYFFASARFNMISGATARLWIIQTQQTAEGVQLRRYDQLALLRNENPVFALSWTIFHVIDEDSPLNGLTADDLAQTDAILVLTVAGIDEDSMQRLNARQTYSQQDIRWQHTYAGITTLSPAVRLLLDYRKFHDAVA